MAHGPSVSREVRIGERQQPEQNRTVDCAEVASYWQAQKSRETLQRINVHWLFILTDHIHIPGIGLGLAWKWGQCGDANVFPHMSLHSKLVPVQYREYDMNYFLMIFRGMSLHSKLVPVQFREYIYYASQLTATPRKFRHNVLTPKLWRFQWQCECIQWKHEQPNQFLSFK